jgi:putative tricarboxylic transport membrane protein
MDMLGIKRKAFADLLLAAAVVAGAVVLFVGAAELPPPRFEPLGSAALPKILGGLIIFFAAIIASKAVLNKETTDAAPPPASKSEPWRGLVVFIALVVYIAALDFGRVPFALGTMVFVSVAGMAMDRFAPKPALIYALLGLIVGAVLNYVFANFLYIKIG